MRVTIKSDGLKEAARTLELTSDRAERGRLLSGNEVRREFEQSSRRRFSRGLRQSGKAWRLAKQRRGLSSRPMQATGDAFAALTRHSGPKAGAVIFKPTQGGVEFGVARGRGSLYYLEVHAKGYDSSKGRVKPRRVVVLDKPARENVAEIVLRRVDGTS